MTAETAGSLRLISRFKDIDGVDLLGRNGRDSFIVCTEDDFHDALTALHDAKTVWVHEVSYTNAANTICFKVDSSSAWKAQGAKLVAKLAWPRRDCQDICHPCAEARS